MRLLIKNGRVIDPANNLEAVQNVWIADGRIIAVGKTLSGFTADRIIDASEHIVCPGLVDLRAHLREPGQEHKATIASETTAAASGGITTLVCHPDTDPVVDTPAVASLIQQRAQAAGSVRVLVLGALTKALEGVELSEMHALKTAGCVGISNGGRPVTNTLVMRRAMEYAATHDLTVFLHAEDPWLRNNGCMHEGQVGTRLGLPGIPEAAETVAVARDLALIQQSGVRAHFCLISTAQAARMIARAQFDGLPVSADVSAHHLHLTEIDVSDFNSLCHVRPPLRTQHDRNALRAALAKGTLSAVCSDHQPHEADAKLAPFASTEPGISALETLLPLTLRLVEEGVLSMTAAIAALTHRPAKLLNIDAGTLGAGHPADVCIFDPVLEWELNTETMISRGRNTPFTGWAFKGRAIMTIANGHIVYEREKEKGRSRKR